MKMDEFYNKLFEFVPDFDLNRKNSPILIATPNSKDRGKTTSLKFLILVLSDFNENNVKYVYGDPQFASILNVSSGGTPSNGWLSKIIQPLGQRQYDLSVVITLNFQDGNQIKVGISTHGDIASMMEDFLCAGSGGSILKSDFKDCQVIFSACHGCGHESYKKLEAICKANSISICNIR